MGRLSHRMAEVWNWEGPVRFLYRSAVKIMLPLLSFRISYIYLGDLTKPFPVIAPKGEFDIRLFQGTNDLPRLLADLPKTEYIEPETIIKRIGRGDWVAVASAGEEVAAYGWATSNPDAVRELEQTLDFRPREMFQYDNYTVPRWRGRRLANALGARVMQHGREIGLLRTLSYVDFETLQSQKATRRVGKRHIQTVFILNFRRMKTPWWITFPSRRPDLEKAAAPG